MPERAGRVEYEYAVLAPDGHVHPRLTLAFAEHVISVNGDGYKLLRRPIPEWEVVER